MTSRHSYVAALAGAALLFALAGCSAAPPSAPTSQEATPPATGGESANSDAIEGTGYRLIAPDGWSVPPNAPPIADIYLIAPEADADGFIDNVNVILGPGSSTTPEEIETTGAAYLEGPAGATEVQVRPRASIGGVEVAHLSAKLTGSGISYWVEQFVVPGDEQTYTVTFSFGEAVTQEEREALALSVLSTWDWD